MSHAPPPSTHCIKLGGSLLTRGGVAEPLRRWLQAERGRAPNENLVLIVGGGGAVEWLREVDRRSPIGAAAAHRAAIAMMDANARAVAGWLPAFELTDAWPPSPATPQAARRLFLPGRFLQAAEPHLPGTTLPVGWSVTSDSIAARVACLLGATLTLVKSIAAATPQDPNGWRRLAEEGLVDPFFPELAAEVPIVKLAALP